MAHNILSFALNLVGTGALIVAGYMLYGYRIGEKNPKEKQTIDKGFAIVLGTIGILSLVITFALNWWTPEELIPHQYMELFGITMGIYSMLLVVGSITLYSGADLRPLSLLAAIGGVWMFQAVNVVLNFNLTRTPTVTAALFGFSGIGGILFLPAILLRNRNPEAFRLARIIGAVFVILMGLLSLYLGFNAMFGHIRSFVELP